MFVVPNIPIGFILTHCIKFMENISIQLQEAFTLLIQKIFMWLDQVVLALPNLILVILALLIGFKLIKYGKRLMGKAAIRSFDNVGVQNLVKNIGTVFLYIALFIIVLSILGLKGPITTVLASAGVMGLAVGLALQDPLMNIFSGIIMSVKHVFKVGDFVESNGFVGSVQEVTLKSTVLRMLSGEEVNIPNKLVLQNPVKNFTTNGVRRVEFTCGISYGDDLELVKQVALNALRPLALDTVERPVEFIYTGFGESSIDFQVRFWTDPVTVWQYLDAKSTAIMTLKAAFDKNDISIPFPIRTLDFGIKGGLELSESLGKSGEKK
jgi:small conductance mechanosensitive channel